MKNKHKKKKEILSRIREIERDIINTPPIYFLRIIRLQNEYLKAIKEFKGLQ